MMYDRKWTFLSGSKNKSPKSSFLPLRLWEKHTFPSTIKGEIINQSGSICDRSKILSAYTAIHLIHLIMAGVWVSACDVMLFRNIFQRRDYSVNICLLSIFLLVSTQTVAGKYFSSEPDYAFEMSQATLWLPWLLTLFNWIHGKGQSWPTFSMELGETRKVRLI